MSSAVAIARVVEDVLAGRLAPMPPQRAAAASFLLAETKDPAVVDVSAISQEMDDRPREIMPYEDHPCIAPPWPAAAICYQNRFGNVIAMLSAAAQRPDEGWPEGGPWETGNIEDWAAVRWRITTGVFVGGWSSTNGRAIQTTGPTRLWRYAVGEQGEPLDLNWVEVDRRFPGERIAKEQLVHLAALNFLACTNVTITEPSRPRAERRRIERTGIRVHELRVYPSGASSTGRGTPGAGSPLTSVRGSFHHYGPAYGKGLLFGRLAGRFWVPAHARGDRTRGEVHKTYTLSPGRRP